MTPNTTHTIKAFISDISCSLSIFIYDNLLWFPRIATFKASDFHFTTTEEAAKQTYGAKQ